jgi:hypothetical protein
LTIRYNGAKITLNRTCTSIVIRDKHGQFVGMRDLPTVIEALDEALAEGTLDLELCEVENHTNYAQPERGQRSENSKPSTRRQKQTEQKPLDFSLSFQQRREHNLGDRHR